MHLTDTHNTDRYDEIRDMEVEFACEPDSLPFVLEAVPEWMAEHGSGSISHSTNVLAALFQNICLMSIES